MFNLMDYKQGEEIKERLLNLENKMNIVITAIAEMMHKFHRIQMECEIIKNPRSRPIFQGTVTPKPTPKKKGK